MKQFICRFFFIGLLVITLMGQSLADCRPGYQAEIKTKIEKLDKAKKIGRIITGSTAGGMGIFWGLMGVMLVGPWGVLIGAQFAVLGSVVGVPFYVSNKIRKARLNKLGEALYLIGQSYAETTNDETLPLQELHRQLLKKHPELTLNQLQEKIRVLNDSDAFCNGQISNSKSLALPRKIFKFLDNSF